MSYIANKQLFAKKMKLKIVKTLNSNDFVIIFVVILDI